MIYFIILIGGLIAWVITCFIWDISNYIIKAARRRNISTINQIIEIMNGGK